MQVRASVVDLPEPYLVAIGRVMVMWAAQEHDLRRVVFRLLGLNAKQGRLAVRSPRVNDMMSMIKQLLSLEEINIDLIKVANLEKALKDMERMRDLVGHGAWVHVKELNIYMIQDTSGNWKPNPKGPPVPRRVMPEGVAITPDELHQLCDEINKTRAMTGTMYQEIDWKLQAKRGQMA